jgi:hypothetical protein
MQDRIYCSKVVLPALALQEQPLVQHLVDQLSD